MEFSTKISGIPCVCRVTHFSPAIPMIVYGSGMGDCSPPEPMEFEFEILDKKGHYASWLQAKVTEEDEKRLLEEYDVELMGIKYGYIS